MTGITQPLREEHKELFPHVESLREAAEALDADFSPSTGEKIDAAYDFLTRHLIPHAQAEDAALYPVVQRVMGASRATATMSRDHVEVGRLTEELSQLRTAAKSGTLSTVQVQGLQRVLYGLYALVKVHFAKEEEIYLPLLDDNLTQAEATAMFESMEAAAHEAKHHLAETAA